MNTNEAFKMFNQKLIIIGAMFQGKTHMKMWDQGFLYASIKLNIPRWNSSKKSRRKYKKMFNIFV